MQLALSAPLPLWTIPSARLAAGLLRALGAQAPVQALVENPFRTQAGLVPPDRLHPLCDLPVLHAAGKVQLVVHLVADDPLHLHQLRYVRMVPGLSSAACAPACTPRSAGSGCRSCAASTATRSWPPCSRA
jgi:hypothetical protein